MLGHAMLGGVVSCTLTVNVQYDVTPMLVAEHDTVLVPRPNTDPEAGLHVGVREMVPDESVATAVYVVVVDGTDPLGCTTWLGGQVMSGGGLALTDM